MRLEGRMAIYNRRFLTIAPTKPQRMNFDGPIRHR
jgi:hypothetical protein